MADVRCPMCGKSNPADQEVCQFCQARLKPLHVSTGDLGGQDAPLPDWLSSLQQDEGQPPPSPPLPDSSEDWLSGLRDQSEEQIDQEDTNWDAATLGEPSRDSSEGGPSSWMEDFRTPSKSLPNLPPEKDTHKSPNEVEEEPDWWRKIGADRSAGIDYRPEETPDWLSDFQKAAPDIEPGMSAQGMDDLPADREEIIAWLAQAQPVEPESNVEQPLEQAGDESPDWLSEVHAETPAWPSQPVEQEPVSKAEQTVEEAETQLPDWLSAVEPEPADWLPDQRLQAPTPEVNQEGVEQPDWLADAEADLTKWPPSQALQDQSPDEVESADKSGGSLPEWLAGAQAGIPDWVSDEDAGVTSDIEAGAPLSASGPESLPEWMVEAGISLVPDSEAEGLPDWAAFDEAEKSAAKGSLQPQTTDQEPLISEEGTFDLDQFVSGEEFVVETGGPLEEDLSWLDELESAFPEITDATLPGGVPSEQDLTGLEPVSSETLPGWLTEGPEGEESSKAFALEGEAEETNISPVDLPSWLEAMRPVTAVGAGLVAAEGAPLGNVEGAGPLAGLRGVLPAEPDIYHASKPPAYTSKIEVTDVHQMHADLLAQLVRSEVEAGPLPARPAITSQNLLRLVIAVVLILGVLFAMLAGFTLVELPGFTPEVFATSQLISGLPGGAPVLVAVDYQPGLSGEMDAASASVIDNLMLRGAHLTLVSTLPTGPVQAERLLAKVNRSGNHQYDSKDQYVNLGFIPGGPTGLQSFAVTPQQTMPMDITGDMVWEEAPLQGISSLSGFAMLVVLTENPDLARAWIEQVQPGLGSTPLIMVLSAQAEPLVRPYYEASSPQVQGLVVGLASGASYEVLLGREGIAAGYWNSFSIGMLVAALLILVGGGISIILARLERTKKTVEGKAKA